MRSLAEPRILRAAAIASLCSATACYPKIALWSARRYPLWYLLLLLLLGSFVLWAFVFAWHPRYTGRPVLTFSLDRKGLMLATLTAVAMALLLNFTLDPAFRQRAPGEYPRNVGDWIAIMLFTLGFSQLFLVFAPLAWLMRLFQGRTIAIPLTVLFGVLVLLARQRSSAQSVAGLEFLGLLAMRVTMSFLSVHLFLRGGVVLVWWWSVLVQSRLLFNLGGGG